MRKAEGKWSYRDYYLEQTYPNRGGYWYACRYDEGAREVRRRSLETTDEGEAKTKLIGLVQASAVRAEDAPHPKDVATVSVLRAYLDGHGATIKTTDLAERASQLVALYLESIKKPTMSVAEWTPARQLAFAKYLADNFRHKPSTIARIFNSIGAAFQDAAKVKIRTDAVGQEIEGSLIGFAPKIAYKEKAIAKELKLPAEKRKTFVPTLDEMARFIDALEADHLRQWIVLALATWARPEAITDLTYAAWDRRAGTLSLNPDGRPQNNKRRSTVLVCQALRTELAVWGKDKELDAPILTWRGESIATVKRAIRRAGQSLSLPIRQKTPRTFMSSQIKALCPGVHREKRSMWLGHVVEEGSRTTDHYEIVGDEYLRDVAIATDFIFAELQTRCKTRLLSAELQLNRADLRRIGARPIKCKVVDNKKV